MLAKNGLLNMEDDETTTDPVIVAVTFDGRKISRFFSHVTGGFKLVDHHCKDPKKVLLCFLIQELIMFKATNIALQ
jgi:hypothetical protein